MRIGISTSVVQRGKTGVGQYLFALLRALQRHAKEHQFVLFALEEDIPLFSFAADAMEIVKVSECFRPPLRNILWHQLELPRLVRAHRIDVLHVPSYRRLIWRRPCALVATIHDLAPFRVAGKYDRLRMLYGRTIVKYLAARQHALITVSHNTARDLAAFSPTSGRVTVIHNGIDHGRFCPGDPAAARTNVQRRFPLDAPFFLYVARLEHPGKNHLRLIQAFEAFKAQTTSPWKLALAGGDWHGAEVIHRAISRSPVSSDICHLGFVADAELPDLYRAAGAFVYPSLYEGFGMPPLEAMACGCPVVCSPKGSLHEVVGDAGILADPYDVQEWAAQLSRLAHDSGIRERLRTEGLARAQCFRWDRTAAATVRVYQEAAAIAAGLSRLASTGDWRQGQKEKRETA